MSDQSPNSFTPIPQNEARQKLWRRGILVWKLDSCQRQIYEKFKSNKNKITVISSSRQIGKSFTLIIIALEAAYQNKNMQIKYAAQTQKAVRKIIQPTLQKILEDCPKDIRPKYDRHEGAYIFPTGSKLFIEGLSDGNAENLRGTAMHLGIVDEGGFVPDLRYIIDSILLPQTSTTRGRLILCSTPPRSSKHEYNDYLREAQFNDAYVKKTIYDWYNDTRNDPPELRDRITLETIEDLKKAAGGEDSSSWLREYMCQIISDGTDSIFPEFLDPALRRDITRENEMPEICDKYVSLDLGWHDYHAALFAFYDFRKNKLIIQDEIFMQGKNTNTALLASIIKQKEAALWTHPDTGELMQPFMRVADDDMITLNDLEQLHGVSFTPTKKDNKESAINEARIRLAAKDIEISPNCKNLLVQLESGIWARGRDGQTKRSFARLAGVGHFDLLDAFIYLVRNIQWSRNPFPAGYGMGGKFISPKYGDLQLTETQQAVKNMILWRRRK
jgi:hypothetical protein